MEPKMYFLSNQQEDHYFEANSRQFQTGRPVCIILLQDVTSPFLAPEFGIMRGAFVALILFLPTLIFNFKCCVWKRNAAILFWLQSRKWESERCSSFKAHAEIHGAVTSAPLHPRPSSSMTGSDQRCHLSACRPLSTMSLLSLIFIHIPAATIRATRVLIEEQ